MQSAPTIDEILRVMKEKNYAVFSNKKGHDLNLVGVRTASVEEERFNDWLTVFYVFDGVWNYFAFPATTDPGVFYRKNPLSVKGTAIVVPGQYRGVYKVGKHRGYKALQQKKPITVFRDNDRNATVDTMRSKETGWFGINIHRANAHKPSVVVGKWSAGCQVLQDPDHFQFLMNLCERGKEKFGNSFTYTLLEESDF